MCLILDELLGPNEQKAFFVENSKELSAAVLYSPLFGRLGELTEEQQQSQIDKLREELRTRSRIVGGSKVAVFNRVNWIGGLSVKQLEVMLILQARMDDDMTVLEYLDTVSPRELEFFVHSNEAVRNLVASLSDG